MTFVFDFPEPTEETIQAALTLWATYYYVYSAATVAGGQPLLDKAGRELGPKLTDHDFCKAAVEGTVRVTDPARGGTLYNYAGRANVAQVDCSIFFPHLEESVQVALGRTRWALASGPFGDGVEGMILIPFRTIAVDRRQLPLPYGSVVYIPQARGKEVTLPSGGVANHDGYFYAADTGGAIKENHIDVFAGTTDRNPFPEFIKSNSANTFQAFRINDPQISVALDSIHREVNQI